MPHYQLPPLRIAATFTALAETIDWGLAAFNIPEQWKTTRGEGVRVAVLDTGIAEAHPDLLDALDDARDFTRSRVGPIDRHGHGTHTAGIIAARHNQTGVVGVAPACRLLVGKVLGDDGGGDSRGVAAGVDWACDHGADVINLSLGSPEADPLLLAAIERAASKGKFVIAAAGNDGHSRRGVNYPARWRDTIAVAAVDRRGNVARFSSRGKEVDIAAPGEDVLSCWYDGGYARLSGTSMAAPFVAGVVALCIARHRNLDNPRTPLRNIADLRLHLRRTAKDSGPTGHDVDYGWGLIDPAKLLTTELPGELPGEVVQPAPQPGGVWLWIPGGRVA